MFLENLFPPIPSEVVGLADEDRDADRQIVLPKKTARRSNAAAPFFRLAFYILFMSCPACGSGAGTAGVGFAGSGARLAGVAGFAAAFGAALAGIGVAVVAAGMAIIGSPRSIASTISTSICWSALVFSI